MSYKRILNEKGKQGPSFGAQNVNLRAGRCFLRRWRFDDFIKRQIRRPWRFVHLCIASRLYESPRSLRIISIARWPWFACCHVFYSNSIISWRGSWITESSLLRQRRGRPVLKGRRCGPRSSSCSISPPVGPEREARTKPRIISRRDLVTEHDDSFLPRCDLFFRKLAQAASRNYPLEHALSIV